MSEPGYANGMGRLLQAAVESAGEAIVITDARGRIRYVNAAFERTTGYAAAEVLGENPRILKSGEQSPSFYRRMWSCLRSGGTFRGEFVNRRKDGTLYRQEATITPILREDGGPGHFVGVGRDVTETRLLEEQLRKAQKVELLGTTAGGIAHDFRNILGVIQTRTELALAAASGGRPGTTDLHVILEEVRRGADLLKGLLSLGNQAPIERRPTALDVLVRDLEPTLRLVFPETVEVALSVEEGIAAEVNPGCIAQILLNLATNSRDAMPNGGRFCLRLAREGGTGPGASEETPPWIRIEASDTGIGMDEHTRRRVFEPLFTTKRDRGGTGLGMPVVARLVSAHGGRIGLDSEPGVGTTLWIRLPAGPTLAEEDGEPEGSPAPAGPAPTSSGSERLLVVEDEPELRRALVMSLERLGYRVRSVSEGGEALRILEEGPVDLVLSDLVMPGLGGLDLYREMGLLGLDRVPVLFMSGYGVADVEADLPDGASRHFLEKPWTLAELAARVRAALDAGSRPTS